MSQTLALLGGAREKVICIGEAVCGPHHIPAKKDPFPKSQSSVAIAQFQPFPNTLNYVYWGREGDPVELLGLNALVCVCEVIVSSISETVDMSC